MQYLGQRERMCHHQIVLQKVFLKYELCKEGKNSQKNQNFQKEQTSKKAVNVWVNRASINCLRDLNKIYANIAHQS